MFGDEQSNRRGETMLKTLGAQVKEHKKTASVFPCNIWKTPHISNTDGASCRYKQKTKAGFERFSLHIYFPS